MNLVEYYKNILKETRARYLRMPNDAELAKRNSDDIFSKLKRERHPHKSGTKSTISKEGREQRVDARISRLISRIKSGDLPYAADAAEYHNLNVDKPYDAWKAMEGEYINRLTQKIGFENLRS
jgi:hypothetical protein